MKGRFTFTKKGKEEKSDLTWVDLLSIEGSYIIIVTFMPHQTNYN